MSKAKPICPLSDYVKDLGKCLKKYSVDELLKFVEEHREIIGDDQVEKLKRSPRDVQELTLWNMILIRRDMPKELKERAAADYQRWRKGQKR